MNEMKMKAKKQEMNWKSRIRQLTRWRTKNERRTNEEWMKNGEERRKTFTDLLMETSRKHYGSISAWIFLTETIFFTQNSLNA